MQVTVLISFQIASSLCFLTSELSTAILRISNDINSEIECTFSKYPDDTKLSDAADKTEGCDAIQRNLERWTEENLRRFNKANCKVLQLVCGNPRYQYRLGDDEIESTPQKKTWG